MDLTPENKQYIDNLCYSELLGRRRFAITGDTWFQGETDNYWSQRMTTVRTEIGDAKHAQISKNIGWGK